VSSCQSISNCGQTPINWLVDARPIYLPEIYACPAVGGYIPVMTEIKVVLPAPFGPRNPKISPLLRRNVNGFRAILLTSPLLLVYFLQISFIRSV
jgi:hypothetical protein